MKADLTKKIGKSLLFTSLVSIVGFSMFNQANTFSQNFSTNRNLVKEQTTVNNWDEFKNASQDTNVSEIVMGSDINLSDVTVSDGISNISNKKIIGNQHKFFNLNLKNEFLIQNTTNTSFDGILFDNVEFFINNVTFNPTSKDDDAIFSNVFVRNMDVNDTTITTDGVFINSIYSSYSAAAGNEWIAFKNLGIIENDFENVDFQDASIFAGTLNSSNPDLVAIESLSIVGNVVNNSTSFSSNINFFTDTVTSGTNSIASLLISNNKITNSASISNLSVYHNFNNSGTFKTSAVILNNELDGDVLIADFLPSTNNVTAYAINPNFSDSSDPNLFGDTKLSNENINGIQINYLNNQTSYNNAIEDIISNIFGTQGYLFTRDADENITGVKLSANPFVNIVNAKLKVTGKKIYEMSLEFQFVYSSFVKSDDFFEMNNLEFSVGSKTFEAEDSLTINSITGTYFTTFKTSKITINDIKNDDLVLKADITDNNSISTSVTVVIDGSFVDGDNIDIKNGLNPGALAAAIIFGIILIILLILFIIWFLRRRKAQQELAKVSGVEGGYYRYVKNEPVEYPELEDGQQEAFYDDGNYQDDYANDDYSQDDYYGAEDSSEILEY